MKSHAEIQNALAEQIRTFAVANPQLWHKIQEPTFAFKLKCYTMMQFQEHASCTQRSTSNSLEATSKNGKAPA